MSNVAKKSSYQSSNDSGRDTSTSHYAYRLIRDEEGNVTDKEFINSLQIFENEGKFGTYWKMRVTGPVPTDDLFIARKRAK